MDGLDTLYIVDYEMSLCVKQKNQKDVSIN